jgi:hypothetical protein
MPSPHASFQHNGHALEMPACGNRGKPNSGFPPFPQSLEIAKDAISTFPQRVQLCPLPEPNASLAPCGRLR